MTAWTAIGLREHPLAVWRAMISTRIAKWPWPLIPAYLPRPLLSV